MCVLGNHDAAVFKEHQRVYFNPHAIVAAGWTVGQLNEDDIAFLKTLPYRISSDNLLFLHATPRAPEEWDYVFSGMEARMQARHFFERICFIGHSHIPGVYPLDAGIMEYDPTHRYVINVGSVGQPRDGNWKSSYGLLDTVAGTYENRRIEYDVDTAAGKILSNKLPGRLAERLKLGL
jgi:diadenosine tetraphosphatase ApaH/serine/threonine PP2A family protein phosphatase